MANQDTATSQTESVESELSEIISEFYIQIHQFLKSQIGADLLNDEIEIEIDVTTNFELEVSISLEADISPFSTIDDEKDLLDQAVDHAFKLLEPKIATWQAKMRQ